MTGKRILSSSSFPRKWGSIFLSLPLLRWIPAGAGMTPVFISLILLFALSGCGFRSVYGERSNSHGDTAVATQLNDIAIEPVHERNGQMLRNNLIDMMYGKGRPAHPLYKLAVTLRSTEEDFGIQADATTTRTMVNMYGDFSLKTDSGKELLTGSAHSTSNINKISNQYATLVARNQAYERTINEVSEQIVSRLSLYFSERERNPQSAGPHPPGDQPLALTTAPDRMRDPVADAMQNMTPKLAPAAAPTVTP